MIGELERELVARVVRSREQLVDPGVADPEIDRAAVVVEPALHRRQMQDLVVARVRAQVRAANHAVAHFQYPQALGNHQPAARECLEECVVQLGDVEVAHHDEVVVLDEVARKARVDPVRQQLQLRAARLDAVAPARVRRDENEIEVARAERCHVRSAPE